MSEVAPEWKPGDRVTLLLPVGYRHAWVSGTVREVDPLGLPPGVRVDFDGEVNGVRDCYATHGELVRGDQTELGNQIAGAIFPRGRANHDN